MNSKLFLILICLIAPTFALATPSSTYWAPSVATCQAFKVPHVTYDTYFGRGPTAGTQGAPNYPVDTGLTIGVLPFSQIQAEVGFDILLPTDDPFLANGKLCTPESSLFDGSPAIGLGIYNSGFKQEATDYNVLYLQIQKTIPNIGGYVSVGGYRAMSSRLMTNSDGNVVQSGFMAGVGSPDIKVNLTGLKKIVLAADIQTGKNVLGGGGFGSYFYFTDTISLLTGPVWFSDKGLQPGGREMLWTVQLDVDIPLE